ncbi:uncharacterized protein LY89DRAFT_295188 [Mollisia scopiformis]|uniref:Uncharacterized protein n=1 Tax=Mollisia scopiformis TaxID=149040 RepID=A0A194XQC7_MOLSC|nr:uncharacterized protein LY89DRAFT_295188 [Mollisia scopiformis]KUJ22366.1 hypothetical protein LY89DRAFT_295188 [Mollisia scopiformis]
MNLSCKNFQVFHKYCMNIGLGKLWRSQTLIRLRTSDSFPFSDSMLIHKYTLRLGSHIKYSAHFNVCLSLGGLLAELRSSPVFLKNIPATQKTKTEFVCSRQTSITEEDVSLTGGRLYGDILLAVLLFIR